MRFDDSLKTVLASDAATGFGAQATWRQLVDLLGRGRTGEVTAAIDRLRSLRPDVPIPIRAASARALACARPPAPLVALFAEDEPVIAAPVLRTANLANDEWLALLPSLTPQGRSVLRHRRDLPEAVVRGLASLGTVDFVLGHVSEAEPVSHAPANQAWLARAEADALPAAPLPIAAPAAPPLAETPFQPVAAVARDIPVVAEALRRVEAERHVPAAVEAPGRFEIADLVARINAFQLGRSEGAVSAPPLSRQCDQFSFETDAAGTIQWIEGVARAALVGVSLAHSAPQGPAQVDGVAAGAFRGRTRFAGARLMVEGSSTAAGAWRLAGSPLFDLGDDRFVGYRGVARRPRPDEIAEPRDEGRAAAESLRQLVHELRTPTNAIAGFAELIEAQLLGPVAPACRNQAGAIRTHTMALLGAIDDLDTAARIAGHARELRPTTVAIEPLIARVLADLAPLAHLRGASVAFTPGEEHRVLADDRAVERLVGRLLAALVSASGPGERLRLDVEAKSDATVAIHVDRPVALAAFGDEALLAIDGDEAGAALDGAPLLGTGFALRLARNLAAELRGTLTIGADRLTLRLPAVLKREVGQAAS